MCEKNHLLIFSSFLDIWENVEWPRFFGPPCIRLCCERVILVEGKVVRGWQWYHWIEGVTEFLLAVYHSVLVASYGALEHLPLAFHLLKSSGHFGAAQTLTSESIFLLSALISFLSIVPLLHQILSTPLDQSAICKGSAAFCSTDFDWGCFDSQNPSLSTLFAVRHFYCVAPIISPLRIS